MKGLVIVSLLVVTFASARRSFRPPCPPNLPQVFCFVDPCLFARCDAFPGAVCRSDYCGGCNAIWSVGGQVVNCDIQVSRPVTRKCPPEDLVNCFVDPCRFAKCPAYPGATCRSDYCGGCNAIWSVGGQVVNCDIQVSRPVTRKCPPEDLVNCFVDPCRFAKCPAHPGATCRSNYCGGCNADWFVNGQAVNCYPAFW